MTSPKRYRLSGWLRFMLRRLAPDVFAHKHAGEHGDFYGDIRLCPLCRKGVERIRP